MNKQKINENQEKQTKKSLKIVIRPHSGLAGDMIVTGLARLAGFDNNDLNERLALLNIPQLMDSIALKEKNINGINGWICEVNLPAEHHHRNLKSIQDLIDKSKLAEEAKLLALKTFQIVATAEAKVHGMKVLKVNFHEVGALDSILDICLASLLFVELNPLELICAPLPLADGTIKCQHGFLPSPAPAVLNMLEGVMVCGFDGVGETVTPTGLALLKAFGAKFANWPTLRVERQALVYGSKVFVGAPNGAIFVSGF